MTVGIRGMGLIGGSFEKAFRKAGHEVLNLKDASSAEIGRCNLVIVCLPPLMVAPWIVEHADDFAADALITDAAGVKGVVCPKVEPVAKTAKTGDDDRAYMDDHIEIFLQAPGKSDYFHLCVGADGSRYDALCKDAKAFTSTAWKSEVKTADGSAEYTVTIPWTIFGADHVAEPGTTYKLLLDINGLFPDPKKPGEFRWFFSGLPRVGFHDVAVGADILIDDNAGRRAGGAN